MGIIDIPGERFNLAGKEATFSLSYLCVVLEMTIATSRGGGHGTWGGSAAGERCSRTPVDGGARGEPPTTVPGPCLPTLGTRPACPPHDGSRQNLHRRDPGSQPQRRIPTPSLARAPRATGCRSFSCSGTHGRRFPIPCPPPAPFPPVGKRDFGWCPEGTHRRELKSRV